MREIRVSATRLALLAACVLAAMLMTISASGTELRGRVVVSGELPAPSALPSSRPRYYWSLDNGVLPARPDRMLPDRHLAIILVERGRPPVRRTSQPLIIRLSDGGMSPSAVVVRPSTMIRFENDDPFTHDLYSESPGVSFGPEPMTRGQTRPLVAPQSGQIEIRCRRAPHLRGFIAVADAAFFVTPAEDGTFRLPVEPGLYTVRTFFEGRWLPENELLVSDAAEQDVEIHIDASTARPRTTSPAPAASPAGAPPPT